MADLQGTLIGDTYPGLIKTIDNATIGAGTKNLTDGSGVPTSMTIGAVNQGLGVTGPINSSTSITAGTTVNGSQLIASQCITTTGAIYAATTAGNCVGIGTTTPNEKLTVNGSISANGNMYLDKGGLYASIGGIGTNGQILQSTGSGIKWATGAAGGSCCGTICGTGTNNYVSKFTPDGTTIGNSIIQDNGSLVGIGVTPSQYKLKVAGGVCATSFTGPLTGNLTGNICGNTTVGGNLTVNGTTCLVGAVTTVSTLDVGAQATLASAKITGTLKDSSNGSGINTQVLQSTGNGIEWVDLPAGSGATGTVGGTGTTNTLTKWTNGAGGVIGNSDITNSATDVTINKCLKVNFEADATRFNGPVTGDLTGNITGDTTVGGSLTVDSTTCLKNKATIASAKICGILEDKDGEQGTSGQILQTTGIGIEWVDLPPGSGATGTVGGTGTSGKLTKWTNNSGTIGDSVIEEASTRIGIGVAPDNTNKLKVDGTVSATRFNGPVTGDLTGDITGNTTVGGCLSVNDTINVAQEATLASAKITGTLKDSGNAAGVSGQYLKSTASGTIWANLPGAGSGSGCTGTVNGTGTLNRISKFSSSTCIINSAIYESSTNGRIGIGEAADASCRLTVNGGACIKGQMVSNNAFIFCNLTVEGNTLLGNDNGIDNTVSCGDFFVGGTNVTRNVSIDAGTGNIDTKGTITATGIIYGCNDIIAFSTSDERLKDNKKCITDANNIINGLNNYCFDWNDKSDREGAGIGVLAQDVQKVLPNAVCERDNGYLAVDYNQFIPVLLQRVKELSAEVEELKAKIN